MDTRLGQHCGWTLVDLSRYSSGLLFSLIVAFAAASALPVPGWADTTEVAPAEITQPPDTAAAPPDSLPVVPSLPVPEEDTALYRQLVDSILADMVGDTIPPDTVPEIREFVPPLMVFDSVTQLHDRIRAVPDWPLPMAYDLAAGDLADWLVFQPAYDVDDLPGPGQSRVYTRWGLVEREAGWSVGGRALSWQRLHFPQSAQFDPVIVPSFDYDSLAAGNDVRLLRPSNWPYRARSSYFLRQGDFSETYSQGKFKRLFTRGYGIDLGFAFYENNGRFANDTRDNTYLRLELVGPLTQKTFWDFRYFQFRDKSTILTDSLFISLNPNRDDLLYVLEGSVYRPPDSSDSSGGWSAGVTLQAGKHDIRDRRNTLDTGDDYQVDEQDKTWTLWGRRIVAGWLLEANAVYDDLRLGTNDDGRWALRLEGERAFGLSRLGLGLVEWAVSDYDTDPVAIEIEAALTSRDRSRGLVPTLRLSRKRVVPSLFDRSADVRSVSILDQSEITVAQYSESGNPELESEWRNEAAVILETGRDSTRRSHLAIEGHAGYVEGYTRWLDTEPDADVAVYQPRSDDARTIGLAAAVHTPLFWNFEWWLNYAAKYAETTDGVRLPDYYPHKASAVISWIAPKFKFNIDIRINSAVIWWYGDSRTDPTPYASSPHVVRWDLSASARIKSFSFHYSVQNVAAFPYRTRAKQPFAGREIRFGINWHFLD